MLHGCPARGRPALPEADPAGPRTSFRYFTQWG